MAEEHRAPRPWRVGTHYGIHVYEESDTSSRQEKSGDDRPVATFHRAEDARAAVEAYNASLPGRRENMAERRTWVIDVCRTCGKLAQWPFCEHRDEKRTDDMSWCVPITVVEKYLRRQERQ